MARLHSVGIGEAAEQALYAENYFFDFDRVGEDIDYLAFVGVGGAITLTSAGGTGAVRLTTGTTPNTGVTCRTPGNLWPWFNNRELNLSARMYLIDAFDDKANLFFGLGVSTDDDFLDDNGGGPNGVGHQYGIYKLEDDPFLWAYGKNFDGVTTLTKTNSKVGRAHNQQTDFFFTLSVQSVVTGGIIRQQYLLDPTGFGGLEILQDQFNKPITHYIPIGTAQSQGMLLTLKNGDTTEQRVDLDWWSVSTTRGLSRVPT